MSMSNLQVPLPFNLTNTYGAFLIGAFVSALLLGVTCLQAFYYFMTYSDGPVIRMSVAALVILEMGQLAIVIHAIYHYLIINFGNPAAALNVVWSIDILFGIVGVTVFIVHLSYAFRIYHISGRRRLIPIFITIIAFVHLCMGWVLAVSLLRLKTIFDVKGFPMTIGKTILVSAIAIDTTIASTLSYYLHRNRNGLKKTDRIINRLIKYTINTGALTSVMDLMALALIITRPKDYLFFSVVLFISALYSNSLLATYNSRKKGMRDQDVVSGTGTGLGLGTMAAAYPTLPQLQTTKIRVSMSDRASVADHDSEMQKDKKVRDSRDGWTPAL